MKGSIAKIIEGSLNNRLLVLVSAALLLLWGGFEAARMPVDVFPDLTAPTVTVIAEAHGMAPEEVETLITFPIETALNGAAGVRRVRSSTGVGIAVIWVEFAWGTDIYQARQIVSEKLQLVRSTLPPDIPPPVLAPVSSIMGEIMFIALTSERHSALELKTTADWVLRRRLLAVPGVAQVIPIGGDTKQYQVLIRPERLAAYRIGINEVVKALKETNENASAGFYVEGGQSSISFMRSAVYIDLRTSPRRWWPCAAISRSWCAILPRCGSVPRSSVVRGRTMPNRPSCWGSRSSRAPIRSNLRNGSIGCLTT
jgi:Cu/Ag efflux pump CusA